MQLVTLVIAMTAFPAVIPQNLYELLIKSFVFIISFSMIGFRDKRPLFILFSTVGEFILLVVLGGTLKPILTIQLFQYPADTNLYVVPLNLSVAQRRLCMWSMMVRLHSIYAAIWNITKLPYL